jgi:hypothetical protein
MKALMIYPLVTTGLLVVLMLWWLIVAAHIISADGLTLNNIKSTGALNYRSPFSKTNTVQELCESKLGCKHNATLNISYGQPLNYYNKSHEDYLVASPSPSGSSTFQNNSNSTGGALGIDGNMNIMSKFFLLVHKYLKKLLFQ